MLEIILVIYLSRRIGKIAEAKGHKRRPNIIFFVVMWFACEIIGVLLGLFLFKGNIQIAYFMALLGAAVGAMIAFRIVNRLEDLTGNDDGMITIDGDDSMG